MNLPNKTDLTGKVAVVTGGGGVLCSTLSKAIAAAGAKVAALDLHPEKAEAIAAEIVAAGGVAKGYACNVLEKDSLEAVRAAVEADLGPVASLPSPHRRINNLQIRQVISLYTTICRAPGMHNGETSRKESF